MRSLESTTTWMVTAYRKAVINKVKELTIELDKVTSSRKMYEKLILNNENVVYPNKVITTIKHRDSNDYYSLNEADSMYKDLDISLLDSSIDEDSKIMLYNYYEKLKNFIIFEINLQKDIAKYSNIKIDDKTMRYVVDTFFIKAEHQLYRNDDNLVLPHNIRIFIKGKYRSYARIKHGVNKIKPSWDKSINLLKELAKTLAPDVLELYNDKLINKARFVEMMRDYTYTKDTPDLPKWLVDDGKDFDLWLVCDRSRSDISTLRAYSIVPTNYISPYVTSVHGIVRKQSTYLKEVVNDIDDIIETPYLGVRDKIRMLENFDKDYCLRTFRTNTDLA